MRKLEGRFANDEAYQNGFNLFEKIIAGNKFYLRLSSSNSTKENITFRTSTALGNSIHGLAQMYVQVRARGDVDLDEFNFEGVTNQTPRTLRISLKEGLTDKDSIAATLIHEFLVHGEPFQTLFDSINSETNADDMARFWRKSRASDNSGDHQHALWGASLTPGLDEVRAFLSGKKLPNRDAQAILAELDRDIESHKRRYPLK
jgi:hypothetical protein